MSAPASDEMVQEIVGQLLTALGVRVVNGSITLHVHERLVQSVETKTNRKLRKA